MVRDECEAMNLFRLTAAMEARFARKELIGRALTRRRDSAR